MSEKSEKDEAQIEKFQKEHGGDIAEASSLITGVGIGANLKGALCLKVYVKDASDIPDVKEEVLRALKIDFEPIGEIHLEQK